MMVDCFAFIGTNSVRGSRGIYTARVDGETLRPEIVSARQAYNAGALALKGNRLYAACEGMTFHGLADGGVTAFSWDRYGTLTETRAQRSFGQRTCALAADDARNNLYAANFYLGTWTAWPLDQYGDPGPHLHCAARFLPGSPLPNLKAGALRRLRGSFAT